VDEDLMLIPLANATGNEHAQPRCSSKPKCIVTAPERVVAR
jgi:hypothetical protein